MYDDKDDAVFDKQAHYLSIRAEAVDMKMQDVTLSIDAYENGGGRRTFSEASHQDRNKNFLSRIWHSLSQAGDVSADMMHYMLGFLQFQESRYARLGNIAAGLHPSITYKVRVRIDKNFRYGVKSTVIRDAKTAIEKLGEAATVLKAAANLAEELCSVSAGASVNALTQVLAGENEEFARELYARYSGEIQKAIKIMGLKKQNDENSFDVWSTEDFTVGGLQPTASLPPKDQQDPKTIRDLRQAIARTNFYMYRRTKINTSTMFEGSVEIEFTGKQLQELYKIGENMIHSVVALNGAAKRFSTGLNNVINGLPRILGGSAIGSRDLDYPEAHMRDFFVAIRAANRLDMINVNTLTTTYHAGMGVAKKIASIIENARTH